MAQASKKIAAQENPQELPPTIHPGQVQVIYADRILNIGIGPVVSRLTLGLEVGPDAFSPFASVVIPTIAFLDAMDFIQKSTGENEQMNTVIIEGIDKIKDHLEKRKK